MDVYDKPIRLHHFGYVVKDQEKVRLFMEDVLGFPLVATWTERTVIRETGEAQEFCHTFYELDGGGALAFFQFADPTMYERTKPAVPAQISRFDHLALRVDQRRYDALKQRLLTSGYQFREIEHGYCHSLYIHMEDGLDLEFTVDADDIDDTMVERRGTARQDLQRWLAGDRTSNNDIRHGKTEHA